MTETEDDTIIVWFGTNGAEWRRKDGRSPRDMAFGSGKPREYRPLASVSPGWPDPLKSPQAEAIRSGKIDMADIVDLFDKMEREIRVHRDTFCETESRTHTPAPAELVMGADGLNDRAFEAARKAYHRTHVGDYGSLRAAIAAYIAVADRNGDHD